MAHWTDVYTASREVPATLALAMTFPTEDAYLASLGWTECERDRYAHLCDFDKEINTLSQLSSGADNDQPPTSFASMVDRLEYLAWAMGSIRFLLWGTVDQAESYTDMWAISKLGAQGIVYTGMKGNHATTGGCVSVDFVDATLTMQEDHSPISPGFKAEFGDWHYSFAVVGKLAGDAESSPLLSGRIGRHIVDTSGCGGSQRHPVAEGNGMPPKVRPLVLAGYVSVVGSVDPRIATAFGSTTIEFSGRTILSNSTCGPNGATFVLPSTLGGAGGFVPTAETLAALANEDDPIFTTIEIDPVADEEHRRKYREYMEESFGPCWEEMLERIKEEIQERDWW